MDAGSNKDSVKAELERELREIVTLAMQTIGRDLAILVMEASTQTGRPVTLQIDAQPGVDGISANFKFLPVEQKFDA